MQISLKLRQRLDRLADETVSIAQMQIRSMAIPPQYAFKRSIAFSYEILIDQLIQDGIITARKDQT